MDIVNFFFIFLASLAILNLVGIALSLFLFFKAKRLIEFSKKGLQIESGLKEGVNDYVEKVVMEWLSKIIASYKETLESGTQDRFDKFSEIIEDQVKSLASHTATQEESVSKQVTLLVSEARNEIEKYKKDRLSNIDSAISDVVEKVSREVLNRTIRTEEHEELVWDALEAAKGEGLFDLGTTGVSKRRETKPKVVSHE